MKKAMFIIIFLLFLLPVVNAATTIKLRTLPGHEIFISIWDKDFTVQQEAPKKYVSDIYGRMTHTYEGTKSPFGVLVIVKVFDIQKYRERLGPYETGGIVELPDLLPEGFTPLDEENEDPVLPANEPLSEQNSQTGTNETPESNNETSKSNDTNITGNVIAENDSFPEISPIVYYIVGAILAIGIISAIVVFIVSKMRQPRAFQYGMEPVKLGSRNKYSSDDKYLDKIEDEIEDVERQIEQYKKRNRLEDAQKRLEEKKKMLENLKKSESTPRSHSHESKYKKRFY